MLIMKVIGAEALKAKINGKHKEIADNFAEAMEDTAQLLEDYAKANAPWNDRTGNARRGLKGEFKRLSATEFQVELSHSVHYGVFLEFGFGGRYAIIEPTLSANKETIRGIMKSKVMY